MFQADRNQQIWGQKMLLRRMTKHVKDQNWFAVFLDFFIVVAGILIAIQISNWNDARQQRALLAKAEYDMQGELYEMYWQATERLALAECRAEAYASLADELRIQSDTWPGKPFPGSSKDPERLFPPVLRSPSRNWSTAVWDTARARGILDQMDPERYYDLIPVYGLASSTEPLEDEIQTLQANLSALAFPTKITQSDRLRYLDVLGELDDKSNLLELMCDQIVSAIDGIGITMPEQYHAEIVTFIEQNNAKLREIYGDCFEPFSLPIFDWMEDRETN